MGTDVRNLLAQSMLLLVSVTGIFAQTNTSGVWSYVFNDSDGVTITAYNGAGGFVSVPSQLDGQPVRQVGNGLPPIFGALNGTVISISIPEGVTNVGDRAFAYCTNLQSVTIPSSVLTVSLDAFAYCQRLTNVSLSDGVRVIGQGAFLGCESLPIVAIPTSVTSIGSYAFANCYNMLSARIPANVSYLGYRAFQGCSNMASVIVGRQIDTIRGEAFSDCPSLSAVIFLGNAPATVGSNFFSGSSPAIYRMSGASGWEDTFLGLPVEVFRASPSEGASVISNSFTFAWNGPTNIPVNVQRSTSLHGPWMTVSSNNFLRTFTDTNSPSGQAFYRSVIP
jgi:hypothetical protein